MTNPRYRHPTSSVGSSVRVITPHNMHSLRNPHSMLNRHQFVSHHEPPPLALTTATTSGVEPQAAVVRCGWQWQGRHRPVLYFLHEFLRSDQ